MGTVGGLRGGWCRMCLACGYPANRVCPLYSGSEEGLDDCGSASHWLPVLLTARTLPPAVCLPSWGLQGLAHTPSGTGTPGSLAALSLSRGPHLAQHGCSAACPRLSGDPSLPLSPGAESLSPHSSVVHSRVPRAPLSCAVSRPWSCTAHPVQPPWGVLCVDGQALRSVVCGL